MPSNPLKITDFKYMIFDVYGTLVDWESGLYAALQPLLCRFHSASTWSRDDAIRAFVSVEGDIQAQHPTMLYADLLAKAHEVLEARLVAAEDGIGDEKESNTLEGTSASAAGIPDAPGESASASASSAVADNEHTIFGKTIKKWEPFADSVKALEELSKRFHLIVLSNVDHASFAYTHTYLSGDTCTSSTYESQKASPLYCRPSPNAHPRNLWLPRLTPGSKSPFSLILTTQDIGAYKPAHAGFIAVLEAIGSEPYLLATPGSNSADMPATLPTLEEIKSKTLSVAQSLTHDHRPARELGITSVWIDRLGASLRPVSFDSCREYGWNWRFETLGDLVQAVANEIKDK